MPTYGKLNILLMNSIYSVFFSAEIQRRLVQTKLYFQFFTFRLKRNILQTYKVATAKKIFQSVYVIGKACFDECFVPCDNLKNYFLQKFIFTQSIFAIAMLLRSLKQLFWKKSVFCACPLSLQYHQGCFTWQHQSQYQSSKLRLPLIKFS